MKNTRNDIETLAAAQAVTLTGAGNGSDANAVEIIATEKGAALTYAGNDDNKLAALEAALGG